MPVVDHLTGYFGLGPSSFHMKKDSIDITTEQQAIIISDYIHKCQVLGKMEPPPDRISETIEWLVKDFLNENSDSLSAIGDILDSAKIKGKLDLQVIENVLNAMFSDGKFNWGRVGATYAFGVKYCAKYCFDENGNGPHCSSEVMQFIGKYVGQHLGHWIETQGGWEAVLSLYPDHRLILKQLRSAGFLALTIGVGSLLNVLSS